MAAQLYSNTKVAECLYEVLKEMVDEGLLDDNVALTVLNQVSMQAVAPPAAPDAAGCS